MLGLHVAEPGVPGVHLGEYRGGHHRGLCRQAPHDRGTGTRRRDEGPSAHPHRSRRSPLRHGTQRRVKSVPSDRVPASPAAALREISYWLDRSRSDSRRSMAFRTAARILDDMPPDEYASRGEDSRWADVPGIGPSSAGVIQATLAGRVPDYIKKVRAAARPLTSSGRDLRSQLRGDLHCHTDESDGSAPVEEMCLLYTSPSPRD